MAIEITGLTKRQKILADILWGIEDWNQVERFIASLPKRDRIDCEGILELMRMALVEEYASTTVLAPGDRMVVDRFGNLVIEIDHG